MQTIGLKKIRFVLFAQDADDGSAHVCLCEHGVGSRVQIAGGMRAEQEQLAYTRPAGVVSRHYFPPRLIQSSVYRILRQSSHIMVRGKMSINPNTAKTVYNK